jgi:hypothetical protein
MQKERQCVGADVGDGIGGGLPGLGRCMEVGAVKGTVLVNPVAERVTLIAWLRIWRTRGNQEDHGCHDRADQEISALRHAGSIS